MVYSVFTNVAFFVQHSRTLEAGPNKTKQSRHKIFFFTEPLIYDEMGDMSALNQQKACLDHSHTHLTTEKANHDLPKKRACVVCPVSKI